VRDLIAYLIEISNRFTALENLNDSRDISRVSKNIKENIKTSVKESLGQHELKHGFMKNIHAFTSKEAG
jgi:hypothetical protein